MRTAGQGAAAPPLPPLTTRGTLPLTAAATIGHELAPVGAYTTLLLHRGQMARAIDVSGGATPALVAWRADNPSERLCLADTVKVQWTAGLKRGHVLLSDMGHVILSLVEDTSGTHDALMGSSVPATGTRHPRTTRQNFVAAAAKLNLTRRDIPTCLNLFAPVSVDPAGRFIWRDGHKYPDDFVDLRAEMDVMLAVSNYSHPLLPNDAAELGAVAVISHRGRDYGPHDPCRGRGGELIRAFAFTDRLAQA